MTAMVYQGQWHTYPYIPHSVRQHNVQSCGGVACSAVVDLTLLRICNANNADYFSD